MKTNFAIVLMTLAPAVSMADIVCDKDNASQTTCTVKVKTDGIYVIRATAISHGGFSSPWMDLTISVNGKDCDYKKISWHNNTAELSGNCQGTFKAGQTHKVIGKSTNNHANSGGVTITIQPSSTNDF